MIIENHKSIEIKSSIDNKRKSAGFASGDPDLIDKFVNGIDIKYMVSSRSDSRENITY